MRYRSLTDNPGLRLSDRTVGAVRPSGIGNATQHTADDPGGAQVARDERLHDHAELAHVQLSRWETWRLKASARAMAFRGIPTLDIGGYPVTTAERYALVAARNTDISALRRQHLKDLKSQLDQLARLTQSLPTLRAAVETADRAADEAERNAPTARSGPSTSEAVTRARTSRARLTATAAATARLTAARKAVADAEQELAAIRARISTASDQYATDTRHIDALARLRIALFDKTLIKYHRHADLLDTVLDRTMPPIPREFITPLVADLEDQL